MAINVDPKNDSSESEVEGYDAENVADDRDDEKELESSEVHDCEQETIR